jgi:hypothetical protein
VVAEVGVHDDDIVSCCELQTVDVGGSEAEFAGAGAQLDVLRADGGDELFGDFLRAVGEPSSTMMTSQSRFLGGEVLVGWSLG